MDMTLSKRGDYVMRSAISLARAYEEGAQRKIREVVAETGLPRTFASQILADLVRAGLATSKAGREGGYRLSRSPEQISVLEVVESAEGPLHAERCALGEGPCRWEAVCPLHETWSQAIVVFRDLLSRTTLAEVAARDRAIEAGTYVVPLDSHRSHPTSVAVSDSIQVELPAARVHAGLVHVAKDLAYQVPDVAEGDRGARVEASLDPLGPAGTEDGEGGRYLLAWRSLGNRGPSHFEANLTVSAVDSERSELGLDGTWHQASGGPGLLNASDVQRHARQAVRLFLRRLARLLEEAPPAGQGSPTGRRAAVSTRPSQP